MVGALEPVVDNVHHHDDAMRVGAEIEERISRTGQSNTADLDALGLRSSFRRYGRQQMSGVTAVIPLLFDTLTSEYDAFFQEAKQSALSILNDEPALDVAVDPLP
jgi:hypothetical protein